MDIPNLPVSKMVREDGYPSDVEYNFRQNLITALQRGAGNEGLVIPVQDAASAAVILAAKDAQGQYTCQLGTMLYIKHPSDFTQDKVVIAVRNDNTYPDTPPVFKTVTLV